MRICSKTTCTLLWLVGVCAGGCHSVAPPSTAALDQLLKPVAVGPDRAVLEIYQIRVAPEQAGQVAATWAAADEQFLSPEARTRLVANGLRAGVIGSSMPSDLAKLLNPAGKSNADAESYEYVVTPTAASSPVGKQVERLGPQEELAVTVGGLRDALTVFLSDEAVSGRTYEPAQPTYLVKAAVDSGQRVNVRATPELQHGDVANRYTGDSEQGIFLMSPSRKREVFSQFAIEANLAPGESLLLGGLDDAAGSLGAALHGATGEDEAGEMRLVLIRVAKVPDSEILADR